MEPRDVKPVRGHYPTSLGVLFIKNGVECSEIHRNNWPSLSIKIAEPALLLTFFFITSKIQCSPNIRLC